MPLPDALRGLVAQLADGSDAVWLAGSYARGDQARFSDVDLGVLAGEARPSRFEVHTSLLVSIATTTAAATRASFRSPAAVGSAIPGWRRAELLHDPGGVGRALRDEALAWRWDSIARETDAWVADRITGLADIALKLLNALERGDLRTAATARNALAVEVPKVLQVNARLLYDSESRLLDEVRAVRGPAWADLHDRALGRSASFDSSLAAGLGLWRDAAATLRALLSQSQREVVDLVSSHGPPGG